MGNNILIVDDAAFMRMMLNDIIKNSGYTVAGEAANGEDAVNKYIALQPDVVMLDLIMPDTDGLMALKEIKKINPKAKVIICSSMMQEAIIKEAIMLGANAFIVKPFLAEKVVQTIKKVIYLR